MRKLYSHVYMLRNSSNPIWRWRYICQVWSQITSQMHLMIHNYSHNTNNIMLSHQIDHSHSSNRTDLGFPLDHHNDRVWLKSITLTDSVYLNFIINWWRLSSLLPPYTADIPHRKKKTHFISPFKSQFYTTPNVSLIPAFNTYITKAFAMLHNSQSKSM
jgi:hypothetical protein